MATQERKLTISGKWLQDNQKEKDYWQKQVEELTHKLHYAEHKRDEARNLRMRHFMSLIDAENEYNYFPVDNLKDLTDDEIKEIIPKY
jgi:hypothetical protein